ncbi:MAG: cell division protein ZapB [Treponema sp.]|jgi:chromosome segregation ATPase|nr:cell division protein ZapB [Treponema sp.]
MVTLEQVKLLETKISKTIDYVKKVTQENSLLKGKLDSYQKRIDELEVLVQRFKEEQSRIEDGILSALDRLNQFEDAVENALSEQGVSGKKAAKGAKSPDSGAEPAKSEAPKQEPSGSVGEDVEEKDPQSAPEEPEPAGWDSLVESGELDIF